MYAVGLRCVFPYYPAVHIRTRKSCSASIVAPSCAGTFGMLRWGDDQCRASMLRPGTTQRDDRTRRVPAEPRCRLQEQLELRGSLLQLKTIVNGIGQADGVLQYWFNGAFIIDRDDVVYRTGAHPTLQFSQFLIAPYIGDGSPVDQSMFDNLRVATSRIP